MASGVMSLLISLLTPHLVYVGGEGREKRLADIDRCEKQAAELVQQATAVPLGVVIACTLCCTNFIQPQSCSWL